MLRLFLWGWNPSWDNATYLTLEVHGANYIPPNSTGLKYGEDIVKHGRPFTTIFDRDFLHMMAHTGPIAPFEDPAQDPAHHTAIFYATAWSPSGNPILLTTVLDLETQTTFVCLMPHRPIATSTPPLTYSASLVTQDSGVTQTRIESEVDRIPNVLLDFDPFTNFHKI